MTDGGPPATNREFSCTNRKGAREGAVKESGQSLNESIPGRGGRAVSKFKASIDRGEFAVQSGLSGRGTKANI